MRKPYSFPARSRAAMRAYILDRKGYANHYTPYPFSWNVKAHRADVLQPKGEHALDPSLDKRWQDHCDRHDIFSEAVDAARYYYHKDYSTYPGNDAGEWEFYFLGRSGGHLSLEKWRGQTMNGRGFDPEEFIDGLSFSDLRTFYKALVCMDSDFTPAKASEEVEYHANYYRHEWEARQNEKLICAARRMEASRPDLYA